MSLSIVSGFNGVTDPDAGAYIAAVEAADGNQLLEFAVGKAINDFVVGCKADGIWNAIKASCILSGARTLSGALVPLVGTAPTNFNFVSGDYDRKTGLVGNGSTKYLDSNRNNNADIATNHHIASYAQRNRANASEILIGARGSGSIDTGGKYSGYRETGNLTQFTSTPNADVRQSGATLSQGVSSFQGLSRSGSLSYQSRVSSTTISHTQTSTSAISGNIFVYSLNNAGSFAAGTNARLAFYSIGESLDLALLDARVSALITAFGVAIP